MGERLLTKLRRRIDQWGLNPVCERVDHPDAAKCGRPADAMATNPNCGHETYICEDCLARAGEVGVWVCPQCPTALTASQSTPIHFRVWKPKTSRV